MSCRHPVRTFVRCCQRSILIAIWRGCSSIAHGRTSLRSGVGHAVLQVDLEKSESRILRIARGSGTHPDEVRGLLKMHKHFEKVFSKLGKNMKGDVGKAMQLQVRCFVVFLVRDPNCVSLEKGLTCDA